MNLIFIILILITNFCFAENSKEYLKNHSLIVLEEENDNNELEYENELSESNLDYESYIPYLPQEEEDLILSIIPGVKKPNIEEIKSILNLDVFSYYGLYDKYDTDLKKSVFKKSSEYKEKLNELKILKERLSTNFYYIKINESLPDYNINKRGFYITGEEIIGLEIGNRKIYFEVPNSYNNFVFNSTLIRAATSNIISDDISGDYVENFITQLMTMGFLELAQIMNGWKKECLKNFATLLKNRKAKLILSPREICIPCDEDKGLLNNRNDIEIYIIFSVVDKMKFTQNLNLSGCDLYEEEYITTANNRLIILNRNDKKIYFDKIYK